jgi:hypothetical protein
MADSAQEKPVEKTYIVARDFKCGGRQWLKGSAVPVADIGEDAVGYLVLTGHLIEK